MYILKIHLDLCKYHEIGRFVNEDEEFDVEAAFYHLKQAAKLNVLEALVNISKIYLNFNHIKNIFYFSVLLNLIKIYFLILFIFLNLFLLNYNNNKKNYSCTSKYFIYVK